MNIVIEQDRGGRMMTSWQKKALPVGRALEIEKGAQVCRNLIINPHNINK